MYGRGSPGGPVIRNPLANAGDTGSIPGLGRFHGATKLTHYNYFACTPEPASGSYGSLQTSSLRSAGREVPALRGLHAAAKAQRSQESTSKGIKEVYQRDN